MDALPFIKEMLSEPALKDFLSNNVPVDVNYLNLIVKELIKVQIFMTTKKFRENPENKKLALMEGLRLTSRKVGNFMREIVPRTSKGQSSSSMSQHLVNDWKVTLNFIIGIVVSYNSFKQTEAEGELEPNFLDAVKKSLDNIKLLENLLPDTTDSSNYTKLNEEKTQAFLLIKAIPALREFKESEMLKLLLELSKELDNLPQQICNACEGQRLALLLIGGLLSFKQRSYDTWNKVKDDLCKIRETDNHGANSYMWHILTYCYDDVPHFLKPCFLHLACYPIDYLIPVTSLTEMWIAEGFVTLVEGETIEDTATKYLEQLVQRSFVYVSKRSLEGRMKYCQVHRSIHEFSIQQSHKDGFLVANPDKENMESLFRLAIHSCNNNQYTEVENNHIHSFLAFGFGKNVLGSAVFLRVLELRNSAIPETALQNMTYLRYLGLRGSNISELPEDIGDMKNLQTLDVRDTIIENLPKSLWNIKTLRHVYVKPNPQIKGPPSTAKINDLQILKTVVVHESWKENFPQFLSNLRKLALTNRDNVKENSNSYWKSISNLLSHLVNLHSMEIVGDTLPSEFLDTRAFPNLETVKSIKLEGIWNCRKLFIDNVQFPPNLTKLTLANSCLKEDPMPRLERVQTLKFLSFQDGAYTGNEMVCSANGFPQLQFFELKKLENLKNLEVKPMGMSQLATLSVVLCPNLNKPRNLEHVTIEDIDNCFQSLA